MTHETFTPPSPGAWELERTHATRPMSRFMRDAFPDAMMKGFKDATRAYGALLDYLEVAIINGFFYMAPRPVGAPKSAKGPPPRLIFMLLTRLHPEIRRRIRRSEEAFRDRHWREELRWWDEEVKPEIAKEAAALLRDDLSALSDLELAVHIRRATEFLKRTIYFHHRMNLCALVPLTDFLNHAVEWTGQTPEDIALVLRGRSPLSAGATAEVEALRAAVQTDPDALALLASSRPPGELLAALQQRPAPVGDALRRYVEVVGLRVLGGYDVSDKHTREHPELLMKILKAAMKGTSSSADTDAGESIRVLRARVPAAHQPSFDALLEEALLTYRVRDERNFCGDSISIGITRRAILTAGARLRTQGRLHAAEHLLDASESEIVSLLERRGGPDADELAERHRWRTTATMDDAPARLGFPPSAPPPAEWLPPSAARLARAVDTGLRLMFAVPPKQEGSGNRLKGFGVSPGTVEGPVRVILDILDLPSIQAGEVLVTTSTGPTFNVILPLLSAIVTERGGALSHAAIVAREYGIPAVVGCPGATAAVKTGTRVRVDGNRGEMWIL